MFFKLDVFQLIAMIVGFDLHIHVHIALKFNTRNNAYIQWQHENKW